MRGQRSRRGHLLGRRRDEIFQDQDSSWEDVIPWQVAYARASKRDFCQDRFREWSDTEETELDKSRAVSAVGPESFCAACLKVLRSGWRSPGRPVKHHQTLSELRLAVHHQCPICVRLVQELRKLGMGPILENQSGYGDTRLRMSVQQSYVSGLPGDLEITVFWETTIVYADKDPETRRYATEVRFECDRDYTGQDPHEPMVEDGGPLLFRSKATSTGSIEITYWLDQCTKHHSCLKGMLKEYVPPRLLDCREHDLRLVEAADVLSSSSDLRYVALSYCWGTGKPNMRLQTDNIHELYKRIGYGDLPQTFKDAVTIVRRLRVPFLWIDALCIIQTGQRHKEDWQRHVLEMAEVYSNCFLNVAASYSKDPTGGCFQQRPDVLSRPCIANMGGSKVFIELNSYGRVGGFHLNSRAWVFQERLLAPRTIHYNDTEVFWECHEHFASSLFQTVERRPPFGSTPFQLPYRWELPAPESDVHRHWFSLVESYTQCHITKPGDRLPAIAAIARRMNERYIHERYIAGFFDSQLPSALLWSRKKGKDTTLSVTDDYAAPSWSWAAVQGHVDFTSALSKDMPTARIEKISVELVDLRNQYGEISCAKLAIEGQVLRVSSTAPGRLDRDAKPVLLGQVMDAGHAKLYRYSFKLLQTAGKIRLLQLDISIVWDRIKPHPNRTWDLLLITRTQGIVIAPVASSNQTDERLFTRVGTWHYYVHGGRWSQVGEHFSVKTERITLV
jgi:hypothetical protein